jgi:hypothetical protein
MSKVFKTNITMLFALLCLSFLVYSCSESNSSSTDTVYKLSQSDLDSSNIVLKLGITGKTEFGEASIGHNNDLKVPSDSTIRDVYQNLIAKNDFTKKGAIIAKKIYYKNPDGSRGNLAITMAMIKRESGYDAANKDWEYLVMPVLPSTNYNLNPNGLVPSSGGSKNPLCIDCHKKAPGDDFSFDK